MNVLSREKQIQVVSALVEGNSLRSIERMTGVRRKTISRLLFRVGRHCRQLLHKRMRHLECKNIQIDEIWTYVKKKQYRLTEEEKLDLTIGDQYVFVALDADTKLVPTFTVGKRTGETAARLLIDLQRRLEYRVQITTDAFSPYEDAMEAVFGGDVDYAQLRKVYHNNGHAGRGRYAPPENVMGVVSMKMNGHPNPEHISTSYVERQNLTMRMHMRRLTRLTNGFSKSLDCLKSQLRLHFAWYNFVRIHRSLRMTPALKAGIVKNLWDIERLIPRY